MQAEFASRRASSRACWWCADNLGTLLDALEAAIADGQRDWESARALREDRDQWRTEVARLRSALDNSTGVNQSLRQRCNQYRAEVEGLRARLAELETIDRADER